MGAAWPWAAGSSPLARGLRPPAAQRTVRAGIIPARAGFTPRGPSPPSWRRGSSPLARGLRSGRVGRLGGSRIIPARAGFTRSASAGAGSAADHPRSRGVYPLWRTCRWYPRGSSPLARGLRGRPPRRGLGRRIIPARAGFTRMCAGGMSGVWDHPRSRGVYRRMPKSITSSPGSSPLARGLPAPLGG